MKIKTFIIFIIVFGWLLQNSLSCQTVYFNNTIDLASEWGVGMSVIADDSAYHVAAVTGPGTMMSIFQLGMSGEEKWIKKYGNSQENWYPGNPGSLKVLNQGYILGGAIETTDSTYGLFIKFDHLFDTILTKRYRNTEDDYMVITNGEICNDGGLIFTGDISRVVGSPDMLLLKTDSLGNEIWRTTKDMGYYEYERGWSVIQTPDSGFVVGGYIYNSAVYHSGDPLIVKFDKNGTFLWSRNPGEYYQDDKAMVCLNHDSTFTALTAIADSIYIPDFDYTRICVIKYSQDGVELWKKKFGGSIAGNFIWNIKPMPDGGYICCGTQGEPEYYDIARYGWMLRLNADGDSIWFRKYTYVENHPYYYNCLNDVVICSDGGFIATGEVWDFNPPYTLQKIWILKVDSIGCDTAGCDTTVSIKEEHGGMEAERHGGMEIWPNPASSEIHVRLNIDHGRFYKEMRLDIYDIFGRIVQEIKIPDEQYEVQIKVEGYPSGIYLALLKGGQDIHASAKFVIVR